MQVFPDQPAASYVAALQATLRLYLCRAPSNVGWTTLENLRVGNDKNPRWWRNPNHTHERFHKIAAMIHTSMPRRIVSTSSEKLLTSARVACL